MYHFKSTTGLAFVLALSAGAAHAQSATSSGTSGAALDTASPHPTTISPEAASEGKTPASPGAATQDAVTTPAPTGGGNDAGVGEIVVTAQFRASNLQQTPIAITALNSAMLEARGIGNVTQVAQSAPNVTLSANASSYGKSTAAFIRGIGQFDFNPALEPGVGVYIDDVYYATVFGTAFDLLDVDRVEILRGPQGTLAGKNSIGGAVKFYSKKPDGNDGGYLELSHGSFGKSEIRGSADFTVVPDKLFVRFAGVGKTGGGYVERRDYACDNPAASNAQRPYSSSCKLGTEGEDRVAGGRIYVRALPTDKLELSIIGDYTNDSSSAAAATLVAATPSLGVDQSPYLAKKPYVTYSTFSGNGYSAEPRNGDVDRGVSGTIDYHLTDDLSIKSITAYRRITAHFTDDPDGSPLAVNLNDVRFDSKQFTEELRLNGKLGSAFDYTVGGFYYKGHVIDGGRAFAVGLFDQLQNDRVINESASVFGHGELSVTDKLKVIGGIRYTHDRKDYLFRRAGAETTPYGLFGLFGVIDGLNNQGNTYKGGRVDWRVAVNYQLASKVMVYAQAATGYKGGGVNPRPFYATQILPFNPETLTSYEVGVKSQFFDNRVRLNVAGFYSRYRNIQLILSSCPFADPPGAPDLCNLVTNAGSAHIFGLEAEAEIHPVDGLTIDASGSYLHFNYTALNPLLVVSSATPYDITPYTPRYKASVGIQYELPVSDVGTMVPRFDVNYQSRIFFTAQNTTVASQGGYAVMNARLTWRSESRKWEASLAVTNLSDKLYYLNRNDSFAAAFGYVTGTPARPREYSISLSRKF